MKDWKGAGSSLGLLHIDCRLTGCAVGILESLYKSVCLSHLKMSFKLMSACLPF